VQRMRVGGDGERGGSMSQKAPALPRCGDTVRHRPTREKWIVAWAEGDDIAWTGWPDGMARLSDCDVIRRYTDAEHRAWVEKWRSTGDRDSRRSRVLRLYGGFAFNQIPGYWKYETSGALRPVVEEYLRGDVLVGEQVTIMRAYLRQWIAYPGWAGTTKLAELRQRVDTLSTHALIRDWLVDALSQGIDPL
jgi:hypothetical protein